MSVAPAVPSGWRTARGSLSVDRPRVAGILNVTPDSFYDGGRHALVDAALAQAERLIGEGAAFLDVGGESTRPGAVPVSARDEIARVVPVIEAIVRRWPDVHLSIDTMKAEVARAALDAGADIINDVTGLRHDPRLGGAVAAAGAGLILMHSRGASTQLADYAQAEYQGDPALVIAEELQAAVARAIACGVSEECLVLDPGLGFGKRTEHSVRAIAGLDRIVDLGYPVLVGPSRKRFIGELSGGLPVEERLPGTIAACVCAFERGARLFRVHDVAPVVHALGVAAAITAVS